MHFFCSTVLNQIKGHDIQSACHLCSRLISDTQRQATAMCSGCLSCLALLLDLEAPPTQEANQCLDEMAYLEHSKTSSCFAHMALRGYLKPVP